MNWYKIFYWITVADSVKGIAQGFAIVVSILFAICFIALLIALAAKAAPESQNESDQVSFKYWITTFRRSFIWSFTVAVILWVIFAATPSRKDCLLIVAGGTVGNFLQSDTASAQIPGDITKFLHLSLEQEIKKISSDSQEQMRKDLGVQTPKEKFIDKVEDLTKEELIEFIKNDSTLIK